MCQVPRPKPGTVSPLGNVTWQLAIGIVSVIAGLPKAGFITQKDEPGRTIDALVDRREPGKRRPFLRGRQLDNSQRLGGEPACRGERRQRRCRETAAIGRVEKRHRASIRGARRPGCVARDDMRPILFAERSHVAAQGGQRVASVVDEDGGAGAARQRFETERAGAGKRVEHRTVGEGQARSRETAMREDVEQRLAGAIAGRPHRLAGRDDKPAPAMHAANNAQRAEPLPAPPRTRSRIRRTHL